ncbi:ABC transporter ATP-binding protein [Kitasatospora sp. NBC_01287]|uniref:ABC transporter ATP-binding protein n=1 Tax=Kitasatospora sp. NBC_01287 TaxID=2903573 RepID=UPI002255D33A|nr:ABC transporter ATP-binding protein [Kitasatospora sp. NBC_01287]MCX4750614.1 ABC transporter ATP-binding protein [Kitasatospora sp. NBC_01287]
MADTITKSDEEMTKEERAAARRERDVRAVEAAKETRTPTVVVDDVHIVYKVHGASAGKGSATSALSRLISRKRSPAITEVHAVRGVSFTAYKGEAVGLIGSNGSGKSTLLSAIAGLLPTEKGGIYTHGQPSLLGVNAALMDDLTGERNVVLGCLAMGMSPAQVKERYPNIVDFSGINEKGEFINLPMRTYSSGMAARLRFSIAAAKTHDVLLIDEALSTGDQAFQRRSEARIRELRKEAGTVFLVSHNNNAIRDTCERTVWIETGKLIMDGPTDEVVGMYERGERP